MRETQRWLNNLCHTVNEAISIREVGIKSVGGDLFTTGIGQGVIVNLNAPVSPMHCRGIERYLKQLSVGYDVRVSGSRVFFLPIQDNYNNEEIIDGEYYIE